MRRYGTAPDQGIIPEDDDVQRDLTPQERTALREEQADAVESGSAGGVERSPGEGRSSPEDDGD